MLDRLPEMRRRAGFRKTKEDQQDRGADLGRPDGKPGVLAGSEMIPGWKRQFGPGCRQTQVALVLVIEARSRPLHVATVVLPYQVEVVPQNIGPGHTTAPDHENDRQHEGFETEGGTGNHDRHS